MGVVDMPGAHQWGWRAERDLKMVPTDGDEDRADDKEGDGEDDLGDEDGDATGAAADDRNPGGPGRSRFVAPEVAAKGERVGQGKEDAAEEQVGSEELDRNVIAEVVEDHVCDNEGGEEGAEERGAAVEEEDTAEDLC